MNTSSLFRRYKEIMLGVAMILFASFYLYMATFIRVRSTVSVSAKLIPEILGILVIVLGVCQILFGIKHLREIRAEDEEEGNVPVVMTPGGSRHVVPILLTFALIIAYAWAYEPLGFILSSSVCMFLQMMLLSPKSVKKPLVFAFISVAVAVTVFVAFRYGLKLSLPRGIIQFI